MTSRPWSRDFVYLLLLLSPLFSLFLCCPKKKWLFWPRPGKVSGVLSGRAENFIVCPFFSFLGEGRNWENLVTYIRGCTTRSYPWDPLAIKRCSSMPPWGSRPSCASLHYRWCTQKRLIVWINVDRTQHKKWSAFNLSSSLFFFLWELHALLLSIGDNLKRGKVFFIIWIHLCFFLVKKRAGRSLLYGWTWKVTRSSSVI